MSTDQNGRQIVATLDDLENLAAEIASGGGGSGIPQGGPLTEDLYVSDQALRSIDSGSNTGASLTLDAATVNEGGTVRGAAGDHPAGGTGAYVGLFPAEDGAAGQGDFGGGSGIAGVAGGSFSITGGDGDDGNDIGAKVTVLPGDGEGNAGLIRLKSNGIIFDVKQMAHLADGATVDDLRDAMIEAGLMAAFG